MRCPVKAAGIPAPTWALRREAMASRSRSRASGVVTTSTCGAPAAAFFPSFSSGSASPASSAAGDGRGVGDRPAAAAGQPGQQDLGDLAEDLDVDDLRPPRLRRGRPGQGRVAGPALRRRPCRLPVVWVRVPAQALSLVAGLPAPLPVL